MADKRKSNRRHFTHYMPVLDEATRQVIGYLSDISLEGFRLDCSQRLPIGRDFQMMIELNFDIADKTEMTFTARSKWCRPDPIDPTSFNIGFEISNMAPEDMVIFQRMFEQYGAQNSVRTKSSQDYLWR
jgi:hypothetical protein